jgi:hypothetical protein
MTSVPVESSAINQMVFDYDQARETGSGQLVVTFKDDRTYKWDSFPLDVLNQWIGAGSAGAFFNRNVRGRY